MAMHELRRPAALCRLFDAAARHLFHYTIIHPKEEDGQWTRSRFPDHAAIDKHDRPSALSLRKNIDVAPKVPSGQPFAT
ncbi:MAG: hypothetical protein GX594_10995 [Pirellulaceae bacterium]|nr:hypothetical protein [Pirellulaceae bacterium]